MAIDISSSIDTSNISGGDANCDRNDILTPFNNTKTLLNNVLNGAQSAEVLRLDELASDPATPDSGKWKLYTKAGGLYLIDDAGAVLGPFIDRDVDENRFDARLTLTTGVPVTTSDVTAATTVYLTPFRGNRIALYDGTRWGYHTLSEISISVPATTSTMYDVFVYDSGGLTLEAVAWTNDTTRATALTLQDGIYVKTGATGRRYAGSFRTTGVSGQTEDSVANRLLWNYYHRAPREIKKTDATASWSYNSTTWRSLNNSTANRIGLVVGVAEDMVKLDVCFYALGGASVIALVGVGVDSTNTNSADVNAGPTTVPSTAMALYRGVVAAGYHYLQIIEAGSSANSFTLYGSHTNLQSGAVGEVWS